LLCQNEVDYDFDGAFPDDVLECLSPYVDDVKTDSSESTWTIPQEVGAGVRGATTQH
jgi:hypothetical protein